MYCSLHVKYSLHSCPYCSHLSILLMKTCMEIVVIAFTWHHGISRSLGFQFVVCTFSELVVVQVSNEILDEMSSYWVDEEVRYKWDTLQRDFQCCGALNLKTGYQDWDKFSNGRNNLAGRPHGVPNSCCLVESDRCGEDDHGIFTDIRAYERIHIHGCLAVMKERLWRDIAPLLLIYIGCGVVICLVTIISLVLASAFVASINRKERHEKDGLGTYQPPLGLHPGTNRYDETSIRGLKQTLDSGLGGGGSLRSSVHTQSPPRTPILKQANTGSSSHRASLYIEPTSESETCI